MAETNDSDSGQKVPPKLVIQPQNGAGSKADGATKSVRITPSGSAPAPAAGGATGGAAPLPSKKETSRISLDAALPTGGEGPKTIRLKPAAEIQDRINRSTIPIQPVSIASLEPPDTSSAEKRKTSRISLDAALAPEAGGDGAPKTIRLKKPGEAATVRVGQGKDAAKGDTSPIEGKPRSDLAAEPQKNIAGRSPVPTQRKTIRVKRPDRGAGVELKPEIARADGEVVAVAAVADRPHVMFLLSAIAAVLVVGVLIYVQSAQSFGPNVSLTQLSYGAPEVDLPWPGKIEPTR